MIKALHPSGQASQNRASVHATIFDFGRDINGNRTAQFVIQGAPGGYALYSSRRRQQVGYGDRDLAAVNAFLKTFEGGGWKLAWLHENGPSVICAGFERDVATAFVNEDEPGNPQQAAPKTSRTTGAHP